LVSSNEQEAGGSPGCDWFLVRSLEQSSDKNRTPGFGEFWTPQETMFGPKLSSHWVLHLRPFRNDEPNAYSVSLKGLLWLLILCLYIEPSTQRLDLTTQFKVAMEENITGESLQQRNGDESRRLQGISIITESCQFAHWRALEVPLTSSSFQVF